jgi:hypothetical protein
MGCSLTALPTSVPPDFDPLTLGPELWLKADALALADNDAVASWTDSSGNGNHATNVSGSQQPTYKTNIVNSLPVVRFDGTADHLYLSGFMASAIAGEAVVVKKVVTDPAPSIARSGLWDWDGVGGAGFATHHPYTDGTIYETWGNTAQQNLGNPTPSLAAWHIYDVMSKSGQMKAWLNGDNFATVGTNTVSFPGAGANAGSFGRSVNNAGGGTAYFLEGDIAEMLWFDYELTTTQRNNLKGYLADKYAITVV